MVRIAITTAVIALFVLGFVYGQGVVHQSQPVCELTSPIEGEVMERLKVTENRVDYILTTDGGCRVLVQTPRWPLYSIGSRLEADGEIQAVGDIPAEYVGYARYLARRDIVATVRWGEVKELSSGSIGARDVIQSRIQRSFPAPTDSFVSAILLAERGMLPETIQEQFRLTGVSHVLAISGLHISLLAGLLLGTVLLLPLSPIWRNFLLLTCLWGYIFFIGAPTSAVRAGWFWTLTMLFWQQAWLVSLATVVLITATVMVSYDPLLLTDVGFQLSLAAVVGIGMMLFLARHRRPVGSGMGRSLIALCLVTVGATLTTWPIIAYHFGIISFVNLIANTLVVPLLPVVMVGALLSLVLSFVWPLLAVAAGLIVHSLFLWMQAVTGVLSRVPGAYIDEVIVPVWLIVVYYLFLVFGSILWLWRQGRSWREIWV